MTWGILNDRRWGIPVILDRVIAHGCGAPEVGGELAEEPVFVMGTARSGGLGDVDHGRPGQVSLRDAAAAGRQMLLGPSGRAFGKGDERAGADRLAEVTGDVIGDRGVDPLLVVSNCCSPGRLQPSWLR